jgi:hypothetical protein
MVCLLAPAAAGGRRREPANRRAACGWLLKA